MRSTGSFKRALIVAGAVALLSLAGMALTLALGLARADRLLDRVSRSQTQLALVTRLEADLNALPVTPPSARATGLADLNRDIAVYRRTIDAEAHVVPREDRAAQIEEGVRAAELAALVISGKPEDVARFRALARQIAATERAEADESIAAMRDLRRTGTLTAIVLPIVLALIGTIGLIAMLANLLRPIGALKRGVAGLARGEMAPVVPGGFSDFDDLAHAFNRMGDEIAAANRHLESQVAERTAELAERNDRLAAIDDNRRLFFTQVGHELRTPITVIMGEAEVALRDVAAPPERLREALAHVVANGQFIDRRLADLLGLASAEDGRLMLANAPVDLGEVVRAASAQAMPYARSSGLTIGTECPTQSLSVQGDASWLQQALLALIDNAVKHAGGAIRMSLIRTADHAALTVTDDGPGVSAEDLPHLFETYYQASNRRGGSGLGLAVARWVAEAHRGRITAENRAEGGLSVRIDLPLAA